MVGAYPSAQRDSNILCHVSFLFSAWHLISSKKKSLRGAFMSPVILFILTVKQKSLTLWRRHITINLESNKGIGISHSLPKFTVKHVCRTWDIGRIEKRRVCLLLFPWSGEKEKIKVWTAMINLKGINCKNKHYV